MSAASGLVKATNRRKYHKRKFQKYSDKMQKRKRFNLPKEP
jgi:hypothetical protein